MGLVAEDPRMIAGEGCCAASGVQIRRGMHVGGDDRAARLREARRRCRRQLTASTIGRWSRLPAEARTHLPDHGSTLSPAKMTQSAPAASAVRTTVPALPGIARLDEDDDQPVPRPGAAVRRSASASPTRGRSATATRPCGVTVSDSAAAASSVTPGDQGSRQASRRAARRGAAPPQRSRTPRARPPGRDRRAHR